MKLKYIVASILYLIGFVRIIDWFIFLQNNKSFNAPFSAELKLKYINIFSLFLQPLFPNNPEPATILSFICFVISGIVFLQSRNRFFIVIAISSFFFSFWNLFSLM